MEILITGGLGYIGSNTAVELLKDDNKVIIVDNLSNSYKENLEKIENLANKKVKFYEGDVCDEKLMNKIFSENKIDVVLHLAGYKYVGDSIKEPLIYYKNNIESTLSLISAMKNNNVNKIVFASSATVYGAGTKEPFVEEDELRPTSPYAQTKLIIEKILESECHSNNNFNATILRYCNPIGADKSGTLGDNAKRKGLSLVPYIAVNILKDEPLTFCGNDWETKDGTPIRDYIYIGDLVKANKLAIENVKGLNIYNVSGGKGGYSVLEILKAFEKETNKKAVYSFTARREGDNAIFLANINKIKKDLNFIPNSTLNDICKSEINFIKNIKKDN
jgi:UDP-glucose 4-epimerase